ncbi:MAG: hypothetical protein QOF32_1078, partial [Gammaproteobacteria bacterium]|nr:hypothetical protein [Gammaproteobacteria bacterium]
MDLPIPKPELVTAEPPQNRVGSDAFARTPQVSIGAGLENLGAGLMDIATPLAARAGQEDAATVTRDADGFPQMGVSPGLFIVGRAGEAYSRASEAATLAVGRTAVAKGMVDLNADHQGNPDGLLEQTKTYAEALKAKYPGVLGIALAGHAEQLGQQYYAGQVNEQNTARVSNEKTAILAQIAQAKTDALQLAKAPGGTDTDQFRESLKTINGFYQQLADNPVFGMPTEKADIEKKYFADYAQASSVQASVDREFNRGGRATAQKKLEDEILNNPKLSIDEQDRQRLYSVGMARLAYLNGEQKAQVDANKSTVDAIWDGLHKGALRPDDPMLDIASERALQLGDSEG